MTDGAGDRTGADVERTPEVVEAIETRTADLVAALAALDDATIRGPSRLAGWNRLTIVCHLRYGAVALERMTRDTLAGRPTAYYPGGRSRQRAATLQPDEGEGPAEVVRSLAATSAALHAVWHVRRPHEWRRTVEEPPGNTDLGPVTLGRLAMSRLLEVEVHGTDLDIGLADWSSTLVEVALPTRLRWLATRRTNHRPVDESIEGTWVLEATDGPTWVVSVERGRVTTHPVDDRHHLTDRVAIIAGASRDLLALLLGRAPRQPLRHGGNLVLAHRFGEAFPGP